MSSAAAGAAAAAAAAAALDVTQKPGGTGLLARSRLLVTTGFTLS